MIALDRTTTYKFLDLETESRSRWIVVCLKEPVMAYAR